MNGTTSSKNVTRNVGQALSWTCLQRPVATKKITANYELISDQPSRCPTKARRFLLTTALAFENSETSPVIHRHRYEGRKSVLEKATTEGRHRLLIFVRITEQED